MKILNFLIIMVLLILISCKNDTEEYPDPNPKVEKYIELLKSNQYDSLNLPAFSYLVIPALLKHRNENQIITNYPHNPISSLMKSECKLGMYVLWTIESIRVVLINNECLIMRFPSQNPILASRVFPELSLVYSDESHQTAAKAYFAWWQNNKEKSFDEIKFIDPLKTTDYRWH